MKKLILLLILAPFFVFAQSKKTALIINKTISTLVWTGYGEAGSYSLTGGLKLQSGVIECDGDNIIKAKCVFDMKTITHDNKELVQHLKNKDFFDVNQFPTVAFELIKIEKGIATGFLTIKGIKKEITFPVSVIIHKNITINGVVSVDRTAFNINYNSSSFFQNLGSYAIKNNFDIAFDLIATQGK